MPGTTCSASRACSRSRSAREPIATGTRGTLPPASAGPPEGTALGGRRVSRRRAAAALGLLLLPVALPPEATAQRRLVLSSGDTLVVPEAELRRMLERTRELRRELEEDPRILYFTGTGPEVPPGDPDPAYPWNGVEVLADSLAAIRTPGNLREADRAYYNYAVLRMWNVRSDPDVSCDSLFAREERAVSGFVDGWIVARTLFGGPAFGPLDELAAARAAGVLRGSIAELGDRQLGGCRRVWSETHPAEIERYRAWGEGRSATGTNGRRDPIQAETHGSRGERPRDRSGHPRVAPRTAARSTTRRRS